MLIKEQLFTSAFVIYPLSLVKYDPTLLKQTINTATLLIRSDFQGLLVTA